MVAYFLYVSTHLFGEGAFGIRFFPLIFSVMIPFIWLFILDIKNDEAFYFVLLFSPIIQVVLFFMTPDIPLLLFGSLFLLSCTKSAQGVLKGILLGLSLLSKYTAVIFYIPLFCEVLKKRISFKEFLLFYVFVPLLIFSPVLYFNANHHWISFQYQLHHGAGNLNPKVRFFVKYIIDVIVAGGIPLSIVGFLRLRKVLYSRVFIYITGVAFFLFFAFFSIFSRQEANWPLFFYPVLLFAGYMGLKRWRRSIIAAFFVLSLPFKPVLLFPPVKNKVFKKEIILKEVAERIRKDSLPVFANTYQHASLLSYYLGKEVPALNIKSRPNQFDLWRRRLPSSFFLFVGIMYSDVKEKFVIDSTLFLIDNIGVYRVRLKGTK